MTGAAAWLDRRHRLCHALAIVLVAMAVVAPVLVIALTGTDRLGIDYRQYMEATRRWLDGGSFYQPWQLTGPYLIPPVPVTNLSELPVLYPPYALGLFVPAAIVPAFLWWLVPMAIIVWHVADARPRPWAWLALGLLIAYPNTAWLVLSGNPVVWAAAALAGALRVGWPGALVLIKPTLLPFAVAGIRTRGWYVSLAAIGIVSVALASMWADYITVLMNARGGAGLLYSLADVPLMLIPVMAWIGRAERVQFRTPRPIFPHE